MGCGGCGNNNATVVHRYTLAMGVRTAPTTAAAHAGIRGGHPAESEHRMEPRRTNPDANIHRRSTTVIVGRGQRRSRWSDTHAMSRWCWVQTATIAAIRVRGCHGRRGRWMGTPDGLRDLGTAATTPAVRFQCCHGRRGRLMGTPDGLWGIGTAATTAAVRVQCCHGRRGRWMGTPDGLRDIGTAATSAAACVRCCYG